MDAVVRWEEALRDSGVDDAGIAQRRGVLDEFCAFTGLDAGEVVESCVDREKGRIVARGRKQIEDLIDEFAAAGTGGDTRASTQRANTVRSFLIHNGVRVLAPKAPWL
ncbi:MAG: hypothetical protein K1X95_14015 [Acidimicrobiia bacterium]|nr:hypothetical protein [Acidimicrobiia bacterium]